MSWENMLDVVNCGKLYNEVLNGIYVCPNTPGSYNHKRAKFFGAYRNKTVGLVAEVRAIVIVHQGGKTAEIKWKNSNESTDSLNHEAITKLAQSPYPARIRESNERDLQVFLLGNQEITDFRKESKGGMFGTKQYFQLPLGINTVKEVASYLYGKDWKDLSKEQINFD